MFLSIHCFWTTAKFGPSEEGNLGRFASPMVRTSNSPHSGADSTPSRNLLQPSHTQILAYGVTSVVSKTCNPSRSPYYSLSVSNVEAKKRSEFLKAVSRMMDSYLHYFNQVQRLESVNLENLQLHP